MPTETLTHNKKISARNQLNGSVEEVTLGTITAKVSVRIAGGALIESVITRQSVEEMGLKVGDTVTALIKSTEAAPGTITPSATNVWVPKCGHSGRAQLKGL